MAVKTIVIISRRVEILELGMGSLHEKMNKLRTLLDEDRAANMVAFRRPPQEALHSAALAVGGVSAWQTPRRTCRAVQAGGAPSTPIANSFDQLSGDDEDLSTEGTPRRQRLMPRAVRQRLSAARRTARALAGGLADPASSLDIGPVNSHPVDVLLKAGIDDHKGAQFQTSDPAEIPSAQHAAEHVSHKEAQFQASDPAEIPSAEYAAEHVSEALGTSLTTEKVQQQSPFDSEANELAWRMLNRFAGEPSEDEVRRLSTALASSDMAAMRDILASKQAEVSVGDSDEDEA